MKKYYARDYRRIAVEKTQPFVGKLAIIYLVLLVITAVCGGLSTVGIGEIAILAINGPISFGCIFICKKLFDKQEPEIQDLFEGFKRFVEAFLVSLLKNIFITLWSLLFIIPGIVKSYSYAMSEYIAYDNPGMAPDVAITESRKLMNGHKWELFCLDFSYIGWLILCSLTFGILTLWVGPRMMAAKYAFYLHITGKDETPVIDYTAE